MKRILAVVAVIVLLFVIYFSLNTKVTRIPVANPDGVISTMTYIDVLGISAFDNGNALVVHTQAIGDYLQFTLYQIAPK